MAADLETDGTLLGVKEMHYADIKTKIRSMNDIIGNLRQQIHESIVQGDILKEQKLWRTMDSLMDRRLSLVNAYFERRN